MEASDIALLIVAVVGPSGVFGGLRIRDKRKVTTVESSLRVAGKKIETLERGEERCREDLEKMRTNLTSREDVWRSERDRFQDEISRQERERHKLAVDLNIALVDKISLLERINNNDRPHKRSST